jgi:hypothetical protein
MRRHGAWRAAFLAASLCLALAGCGGDSSGGRSAAIECAPFARALTGVALSGDAADWWREAAGHYARSSQPAVGDLLVFRRSSRLPAGHVGVVTQVLSRGIVLVTQANWVHHRVGQDQRVEDLSGNWTRVRVWWPPSGQMGITPYATYGFIRPDHSLSHDELRAATPRAIRIAEKGD